MQRMREATEHEMTETTSMPMCPMAATCKSMMKKPMSGVFLLVPGILFIAVGIVILVEPRILVWLAAAASILMGVAMLMFVSFVRRIGSQFGTHGHA